MPSKAPLYTTHRLVTADRLGRAVTVELRQTTEPQSVARLPVLSGTDPIRVAWTFSDDLGLGVLTYTLQLDLFDEVTPAAPGGFAHLVETVAPEALELRVSVAGVGVLFEGAPVYGGVQRGLWADRRRVRLRFAATGLRRGTVPDALPYANGAVARADLLLLDALGSATLNADGEHQLYYAHPWRTQAVWPHPSPDVTSFLEQVYVPWTRALIGEPWPRVVEGLCRPLMLRLGRSLTLGRYLVAEALQGWGGAGYTVQGPLVAPTTVTPAPLGSVEAGGAVSGERVGFVRVATSQGQDGDPPGVVRDRRGVVADAPATLGDEPTGFRALSMTVDYASEYGTGTAPFSDGDLLALVGWSGIGSTLRPVGQVYGLGLSVTDACLQLETAVARRLYGWLSAARRRVRIVARSLVDPMLPVTSSLDGGVARVYLPTQGTWHVLSVRTECQLIEMSAVGEAAPAAPAAWYSVEHPGTAVIITGWQSYTPMIRSNRRLATLSLGADRLIGGTWSPAALRRAGGSVVPSVPLSSVTTWNEVEPERLTVEFQRSVYAGQTLRWRVDYAGVAAWTGAPFVVPA